jgi:cytochrome oxidase assembly protein ShyY1
MRRRYRRRRMYRFLLKPKWLAFHLLCIAFIAGMVWAGFWQLRRYHEHERFKREVNEKANADVVPFSSLIGTGTPAELQWRPVEVTGTFVPDRQFEVVNLSQDGESGHDAVNGLLLADGTVLLVNRGFAVGADPLPAAPTGQVTLVGRIRTTQNAGIGQAADDGSQRLTQIRRVDLGALSRQFDQKVQPVFLDWLEYRPQPAASDGLVPVAFPDLDGGPPHLSYTVQWFIFSVCVVIGWVLAVRKSINTRKGKPKKRKPVLIPEQYASGG